MKDLFTTIILAGCFLLFSCKESYDPPVIAAADQYLIIEGMLNNGGPTTIKLSRSRPLNDQLSKPELKAIVNIESDKGQKTSLTDKGNGEYTAMVNVNKADKYRLSVKTSGGKEYLSEFVPVLETPQIDNLAWKKTNDGLVISASTHDPKNSTRFYRWGYEETWLREIKSRSFLEYVNGAMRRRATPTNIVCYDNFTAEPLALASTQKLSEDVVHEAPVNLIPINSEKLSNKYSINVKQYALEPKAYEYWQAMKKNTEQLGSIFDPQPSYMYGNIYSVSNSKELVVGYFGACNITEKRIFLTALETNWVIYIPPTDGPPIPNPCDLREVIETRPERQAAFFASYFGNLPGQKAWTPLEEIWDTNDNGATYFLAGYTAVEKFTCADCGPNYIKPSWWK